MQNNFGNAAEVRTLSNLEFSNLFGYFIKVCEGKYCSCRMSRGQIIIPYVPKFYVSFSMLLKRLYDLGATNGSSIWR